MAGLCQPDPGGEGERFVILTTDAILRYFRFTADAVDFGAGTVEKLAV